MVRLLLLFILVPALELGILMEIGRHLGTLPTLALIVSTGTLGAFLARLQGLSALKAARAQMERGELPAGSLADGVLILVAAALLVTPGVLTDAAGFLLLVPRVRGRIKVALLERFRRSVEERRIQVHVAGVGDSPLAGTENEWTRESATSVERDSTERSSRTNEPPKYRIH
jgi:UPF0716 protein FxsA